MTTKEVYREINQGDVVLVPFPYTDLTTTKKRPALVISSTLFNRISEDLIIVMITSNTKSGFKEYNVSLDNSDFEELWGKPIKPSIIKPYKIVSVKKTLILKTIGRIKQKKLKEVLEKLKEILGDDPNKGL